MLEFDKGWYCQNCEYIINKQQHQIDKKNRRQDQYFSTRLPYANKNIREIFISLANTNSTEDMIDKLQSLKGKTKLKFYKNISNYYDEMNNKNFRFGEDPFAKNAEGIGKIYHEVLMLMKFLQTKPQVKKMNINYYDLYYTVIKNRDEKENVNDQYENDYTNYEDFIIPNHNISIKPRETILSREKLDLR